MTRMEDIQNAISANDSRIWDRHHAAAVGNFLQYAALGAGGMGLFHLLKKTKKNLDANLPQKPKYNEIATAGFLPFDQSAAAAPVEKLSSAWDTAGPTSALQKALFYGMPVAGAGIGAYLNASRAKKDKFRAALTGATMGGGVGLAGGLGLTNFGNLVAESQRKGMDQMPQTNSWGLNEGLLYAARMAAMPAGMVAGGALANTLLDSHDTKEKEEKNVDAIQKARNEYFNTLVADEKAAAALDTAFAFYKKSGWADNFPGPAAWAGHGASGAGAASAGLNQNQNSATNFVGDGFTLLTALTALASLGAGGVGATYMYNKTKDRSAAKQLARARMARERLGALPGAWIDPREVAQVKATAMGNQNTAAV